MFQLLIIPPVLPHKQWGWNVAAWLPGVITHFYHNWLWMLNCRWKWEAIFQHLVFKSHLLWLISYFKWTFAFLIKKSNQVSPFEKINRSVFWFCLWQGWNDFPLIGCIFLFVISNRAASSLSCKHTPNNALAFLLLYMKYALWFHANWVWMRDIFRQQAWVVNLANGD